jgi:hypothetical protein
MDHQGKKRISIATIIMLLLLQHQLTLGQAISGRLDATHWDFTKKHLPLIGHWYFFNGALLSASECEQAKGKLVPVPGLWNDWNDNGKGVGYGTYYLNVVLPPSIREYAIELPQVYNSYALYVDDELIANNGVVSRTASTSTPQWRPQVVVFQAKRDSIQLVLQMSNFHHNKGGMREAIYLGDPMRLLQKWNLTFSSVIALIVVLLIEGIAFLILFFTRQKQKVILFFSLMCFTWVARVCFSNLYPVTHYFPDFNWTAAVKIEYITLYAMMIFSTMFLNRLFRESGSSRFQALIITMNIVFALFTLFAPPIIFTRWLNLFLMMVVVTLLYSAVVVVRAMIMDKAGVWFLILGVVVGILMLGYDLASYSSVTISNMLINSIGHIIMFLFVTVGLLIHLGIIKSKIRSRNMLTYGDLYETDEKKKK